MTLNGVIALTCIYSPYFALFHRIR